MVQRQEINSTIWFPTCGFPLNIFIKHWKGLSLKGLVKTILWSFLVVKQKLCLHLLFLTKTNVSLRCKKNMFDLICISTEYLKADLEKQLNYAFTSIVASLPSSKSFVGTLPRFFAFCRCHLSMIRIT